LGKKESEGKKTDRMHVAGGGKETFFLPIIENALVYVTGFFRQLIPTGSFENAYVAPVTSIVPFQLTTS